MEIKEVKKLRDDLETKISKLLEEFQNKTQVTIKGIDVQYAYAGFTNSGYLPIYVKLELEL